MQLLPARLKHRKIHARGFRLDHTATRCNQLAFGDYGIQALESGKVTARQIEAARVAAGHYLGRTAKLWIRIFPQTSVSKHPAETRMGSGKGEIEYWCAHVDAGTVLFEFAGITEDMARETLRRQSFKLPLRTRMVRREVHPHAAAIKAGTT
jgi:large subunit ribosomal protein L16